MFISINRQIRDIGDSAFKRIKVVSNSIYKQIKVKEPMFEITGTFNGKRIRVIGNSIRVTSDKIFVDGKEIDPDTCLVKNEKKNFWTWLKGLINVV